MLFTRKSESRGYPEPEPPDAQGEPRVMAEPSHLDPDSTPSQSFIDASLTIVGDLHSEGNVQVDGRICGNVRCAQLIVSSDAAITGTVLAEQAVVRGCITGTIRASMVILQETARVKSDIAYAQLIIDDGAAFEGSVRRSQNPLAEAETHLGELQSMVGAESSDAAAGAPGNGRDAGGRGADVAPAMTERRGSNGHADTQA